MPEDRVFCILITQNTRNFSVVKSVNKRDVYHHFCSVYDLSPMARYGFPSSHTSILAIRFMIQGIPAAEFYVR